jgi:peptide/nickel transport system permease protein
MGNYMVRRVAQILPVLILASVAIWAMSFALPGDPARMLSREDATEAEIEAKRIELGLDRPVWVQYGLWVQRVAQGDLGESFASRQPVSELIGRRMIPTIQLGAIGVTIGLLLSLPTGILGAIAPHKWYGRLFGLYSGLALSVPPFWVGILLILLFAVQLGWFPSAADYVSVFESPIEALRLALLPAIAMGMYASGVFARFLRASTTEVLDMDHVRTARSKGISRTRVLRMHVVRNALLPFITVVGLRLGALISGSVVIEVVFNYPGLGRLLVTAIGVRDYPVIQSVFLLVVVIFAIVNLVVDLAYAYADPRIRYGD